MQRQGSVGEENYLRQREKGKFSYRYFGRGCHLSVKTVTALSVLTLTDLSAAISPLEAFLKG
jgi:hypothetical protein